MGGASMRGAFSFAARYRLGENAPRRLAPPPTVASGFVECDAGSSCHETREVPGVAPRGPCRGVEEVVASVVVVDYAQAG
jgi:hypothetical protein